MATETQAPATAPVSSPAVELTINAKPTTDASAEKTDTQECTCGAAKPTKNQPKEMPAEIWEEEDEFIAPRVGRARRRPIPPPPRPYIYRSRSRSPPAVSAVNSSTALLAKIGTSDGVVDLPYPARSSCYLATYPFADKDLKKWSWLLIRGVEDIFLSERDDDDDDGFPAPPRRRGRNRSPNWDAGVITYNNDIPSIYVSRALDTTVIPEDTKQKVNFMIVVQNRNRPQSSKLMVAEGRKAAGIIIYYEALSGNSVVFVGATVETGRLGRRKLVKVESLEEAVKLQSEEAGGAVGVVC